MGQETFVLCDTDVIIEFYRNNPTIISELKKIGQQMSLLVSLQLEN
jgi:rRNA-processing protein FCF1